jgi:hypothetical protein
MTSYEAAFENSPAIDTANLLRTLTASRSARKLFGDEEYRAHDIIGRRRMLMRDDSYLLSVAAYQDDEIGHMAEIINPVLGSEMRPPAVGHVQFTHASNRTTMAGALYVSEQQVIAKLDIHFDNEDLLSQAAQESFATASDLGLGELWTNALLARYRNEQLNNSVALKHPQILMLNTTLAKLGEG